MQPATPTVFINVFRNAKADCVEAHDGVYNSRAEAADAAEQYADSYLFTLTDCGKVDLTGDFSETWHEHRDFDATVDAKIDAMRESV